MKKKHIQFFLRDFILQKKKNTFNFFLRDFILWKKKTHLIFFVFFFWGTLYFMKKKHI